MEFSKEQIEKIKFIYKKQVEMNNDINKKDQWGYIWTIGTDFFLHLLRINNLYYWILKNIDFDIREEEIFFEWKESSKRSKNNGKRYYLNISKRNICKEKNRKDKYLISGIFKKNKESWIFEKEKYFNTLENISDLSAESTMRQFLEIMSSIGYLEIKEKFEPTNFFALIFKSKETNDYIINKNELIINFVNNFNVCFDLKYIKGYSMRDIFLGLHAFFLYELCNKHYSICLNIELNLRKSRNKPILLTELFKLNKRGESKMWKHFNAQTRMKKLLQNELKLSMEVFDNLNNFLFEKYNNDWSVKYLTIQNQNLEIFAKNGKGRLGQVQYRQYLLYDMKRLIEFNNDIFINKNDLIKGVKIPDVIEASHILDLPKCEENEKFDPQNGLLLDPTIHRYFDRDIIIFDHEGNILIKIENYDEVVERIALKNLQYHLLPSILTPETKSYINKRINSNGINLKDYRRFQQII